MKTIVKRSALAWCCLALALFLTTNVPVMYAQQECNIIGGAPGPTTGAIASGDTAQTSRLFRDGRGGTCLFLRPPTTSAGSFLSDNYTFTNTSGGPICVYVDLDSVGCGVATNQISVAGYNTTYNPAAITTNLIGDPGLSTGTSFATSMNFNVPTGGTYVIVVHNVNAGTFCASYTFRQTWANGCRQPGFDAANDGSADLAVFRPVGGQASWFSQALAGGTVTQSQLGSSGDVAVPGDYTGDETTDVAVYRDGASGIWYTSTNAGTNYGAKYWGTTGDVPVQGDYDRDGITDLAIFRPGATGTYFILQSADNTARILPLGVNGDRAVPADYDGDGKTDPAVFRSSNGLWTFLNSSGNFAGYTSAFHGVQTDIPVPADYDGDAKADIAIFRPTEGNWYILRTRLTATGIGSNLTVPFGIAGDKPVPADYDGDKLADQAVFRPATGRWYINRSGGAGPAEATFGLATDVPASAPNPNTNQ
jgi:hypothetical protein